MASIKTGLSPPKFEIALKARGGSILVLGFHGIGTSRAEYITSSTSLSSKHCWVEHRTYIVTRSSVRHKRKQEKVMYVQYVIPIHQEMTGIKFFFFRTMMMMSYT